jgi:hypothetical protein
MKLRNSLISLSALALAVLAPSSSRGQNTAYGTGALSSLTTGTLNSAFGRNALHLTTTGYGNVAVGDLTLYSNTSGRYNIGMGEEALYYNTTGESNLAIGYFNLHGNSSGTQNVALGDGCMVSNTTGTANVAIGTSVMGGNTTGLYNIAIGNLALYQNTTGNANVAIGNYSMGYAGSVLYSNTAVGYSALQYVDGTGNSAFGANAGGGTGDYNISIGNNSGSAITSGSYNIHIGNTGVLGDNYTIRLGAPDTHVATFVAGVRDTVLAGGVPVFIDADGQMGTLASGGLQYYSDLAVSGALFSVPGPVGSQPPYTSGPESFVAMLQCTTTSSAAVVFTSDGATPATSGAGENVLIPPNNTAWNCRITIVGRNQSSGTNAGASYSRELTCLIKRSGGTFTLYGPNLTTALGDTAMAPTLTVVSTGGYLKISTSGINATNYPIVKWTARVEVTASTN